MYMALFKPVIMHVSGGIVSVLECIFAALIGQNYAFMQL